MFNTHRNYTLSTGVKNNTIAVLNWSGGKNIAVIYHRTPVVQKAGRNVVITNGGWDTLSTRTVINRALDQIPGFQGCYLERRKGKTLLNRFGKREEFTGTATLRLKREALNA